MHFYPNKTDNRFKINVDSRRTRVARETRELVRELLGVLLDVRKWSPYATSNRNQYGTDRRDRTTYGLANYTPIVINLGPSRSCEVLGKSVALFFDAMWLMVVGMNI